MTEGEETQRHERPADPPDEETPPSARYDMPAQIVEAIHASLYAGPIPPPEALARYEKTLPGAADRSLTMAESQQAHRQATETAVVNYEVRRGMAGLVAGVTVTLAAFALAGALAALGQTTFGFATAMVAIASLAGVFVVGHFGRRKERTARLDETLNPALDVAEPPAEQPSGPQLPRE